MRGLTTCLRVLAAPRAAFARLAQQPMWGWAAVCGTALSIAAIELSARAQLHLLALARQHQVALTPPAQQASVRVAMAHVATLGKFFLLLGALTGPWVLWFFVSVFLMLAAAVLRRPASFSAAWVAVLNSYIVYAVGIAINAALVSGTDPATVTSPLQLLRLPSLAMVLPAGPVAAFLAAYNVINLWYFAVFAISIQRLLKVGQAPAIVVTCIYSVGVGLLLAATAR